MKTRWMARGKPPKAVTLVLVARGSFTRRYSILQTEAWTGSRQGALEECVRRNTPAPPTEPTVHATTGKSLRLADKPPGLTVAEALGIEVPKNAPGGQRIGTPTSSPVRKSIRGERDAELDYDGFADIDGYGRAER